MSKIPYLEKLKDPRWQKRRLKVMEYAHWRCQICGVQNKTLHCHHSYYTRGKLPWQYPDGSIICICDVCHDKVHGKKQFQPSTLPIEPVPGPIIPNTPVPQPEAKSHFAHLKAMLAAIPDDPNHRRES